MIKKLLPLLLLIMIGCSKVEYSSLVFRDGLYYLPYEKEPFSGSVESFDGEFDDCFEGYIKKGEFHGYFQYYYDEYVESDELPELREPETPSILQDLRDILTENGKYKKVCTERLEEEGNYKNDLKDGIWVLWDEYGNLFEEEIWKDGEYIESKEK